MGSHCSRSPEYEFDNSNLQCQILPETSIPCVNQTKILKCNHFQLPKESPQEGVRVSNIQTIVVVPENDEQGINVMRSLAQTGNKLILIQKKDRLGPVGSTESTASKPYKGILKNKSHERKLDTQSQDEISHFMTSPPKTVRTNQRKVKIM